jgi:hypothetical protein
MEVPMGEWKGPCRCGKCGAEYMAGHFREDYHLSDGGVFCDGGMKPHERRAPDALVKALRECLQAALDESGHTEYCHARKGPEHEQWTVEADCNCWVEAARTALRPVERGEEGRRPIRDAANYESGEET